MAKKKNQNLEEQTKFSTFQQESGIKTFLKDALTRTNQSYSEEKADKILSKFNNDYDAVIDFAGKKAGIKDKDKFRSGVYDRYKLVKPTEEIQAELSFLRKPTATDTEQGYDKIKELQEDKQLAQSMLQRLTSDEKPLPLIDKPEVQADVTRVEKPKVILDEDQFLTPEQKLEKAELAHKGYREADLQSKLGEIDRAIAEQAKVNIEKFGYASAEHEAVETEYKNYATKIDEAIKEKAEHEQMVGFGLGGAIIKSRPEDVAKVKDLRNIKELYGKMGKILGAPQGEKFSDEMSGLLYGFSKNFFTKDFATLGLNEMDRLLNVKEAFDNKKQIESQIKDYGKRADGTKKGSGWLGEIKLPDGNVATEYSIGINFDGKEVEIPSLIPTLTEEEKELMINDIIPNKKRVPEEIVDKAVSFARNRLREDKSPFISNEEYIKTQMPQEQLALLDTYKQLLEIQAGSRANFGTTLGEGLQQMIPFIAQFAATGGVGATAKKAVKEFIEAKTKSAIAGRITGAVAKPLVQAAVMFPAELQNYAERVAPTMDEKGNLIEGQEPINAAFKAYLTTVAEVAGEDIGEFTTKIANKAARKNFAKMIANNAGKSQQLLGKLSLALTKETNIPGIQGFVFEGIGEEATGIMQAAIDQDGNFFTMEAQKQLWALSLLASGTFASMSVPGRIRTRTQFNNAQELLNDIPNSSYVSSVESVAQNYIDPEESIGALDEISKDFEISEEDYLKARNFIAKSARYNQMNTARAIQIEERIAQSIGTDGNVTLTQYNGQVYSVRNPQDLGPGNESKVIYLKDREGNVKPVISSKVTEYETKSPYQIKEEQIGEQDQVDDAINEEQQIQADAAQRGLIEGKTVNTPNGKRTLVSVNPDGTSTVTTQKGEQEIVNTDEIEAYKTQEQKDAEKVEEEAQLAIMEGIDEGAEVVSDEPMFEGSDVRVIDFSNGQSKIITPEGEQVFNTVEDRDAAIGELAQGEIEATQETIDDMPPEQAFAAMRKEDPEIANEIFQGEINDLRAQAEEARSQVIETKSRKEKQTLLLQAKELESEAQRLEGILADPTVLDEVIEEEVVEPVIEEEVSQEQQVFDAADALQSEFVQEQESAPYEQLLPWQKELLNMKVNRQSFFDFSDQSFDTPIMQKRWFNTKAEENPNADIDRVAQDLSEGLDREITTQEIADFIVQYPGRSVSKETDRMKEIRREYKDLTGQSINQHSKLREKLGLEAPKATKQVEVEGFEEIEETVPFRINITEKAQEDIKNRQNAIKELNKLQETYGIPVNVINSDELSPEAKAKARQVGAPKAYYQNGQVFILSDKIERVSDAKKSYLHEALVHKGLDLVFEAGPVTLLGKTYETKDQLLDDVFNKSSNETIADRANVYFAGTPIDQLTDSQKRELAEEILATLSETESPRVQVMFDKLYNFIKKLFGFTSKQFSKADLRNMLREHRELIIKQKRDAESLREDERQVPETRTIEETSAEKSSEDLQRQAEARAKAGEQERVVFRVAESPQELEEFVKDSQIKETVFHGTPNALFDEFREGTMFTKNKDYAERYINQGASSVQYKKTADRPGVYSAKLNIKKPFDTRDEEARDIFENEYQAMYSPELSERGLVDWMEADDLAEFLQEEYPEYDGLVLDEGGEPVAPGMPTEQYQEVEDGVGWRGESYFIFNPEQALVEKVEDIELPQDIRFRILGEKGAESLDKYDESTIRLDNLDIAKEMEVEKKSAKDIRLATGWEKGVDGKWRYEVSDLQTSFESIDNMPYESAEGSRWKKGKLNDIINDKNLFIEYPDLKNVDLVLYDFRHPDMVSGEYREGSAKWDWDPTITVWDVSYKDGLTDSQKSTIIHEIQHAIQDEEGFVFGGSQRSFKETPMNPKWEEWKSENNQKIVSEWNKIYNSPEYKLELDASNKLFNDVFEPKFDELKEIRTVENFKEVRKRQKEIIEEFEEIQKERFPLITQLDDIARMGIISEPAKRIDKFDAYRRLGGEVESRNVQKRLQMSDEERLNTLLQETEDVAREDQLFLQDGIGQSFKDLQPKFRVAESQKELKDLPTVYHGSDIAIDEFEIGRGSGKASRNKAGIFFTTDPEFAQSWGDNLNERKLKLEKPVTVDSIDPIIKEIFGEEGFSGNIKAITKKKADKLKEAGFDGVIGWERWTDWKTNERKRSDVYMAFSTEGIIKPTEVKVEEAREQVEQNPSEKQIESGNYKKGHVSFDGFNVTIENPRGSIRSGVDEQGNKWSAIMPSDYGYFKRTEGADGDQVDVHLGPNLESDKVYVVDQVNPETGAFDEVKVMMGFNSISEARNAYNEAYEEGWQGLGNITRTTKQGLKDWLKEGDTKKPYAEVESVRFRILGERGAKALDQFDEANVRLNNLQVAKDMKKANKSAKEIKLATGWELGADKKWKYEIGEGKLSKNFEEADTLEQAYEDENLYKAYPELKDVMIGGLSLEEEVPGGLYIPEGVDGKPTIYAGASNKKDLQRVIDHEIQHFIQDSEGFYQGGFEGDFKAPEGVDEYTAYLNLSGEVEARNVESRLGMTQEERAKTLLEETEDVSRKDQLFLKNGVAKYIPTEDVKFRVTSQDPEVQKMLDRLQLVQKLSKTAARIRGMEEDVKKAFPLMRQNIIDQISAFKEGAKLSKADTKEMIKEVQKAITDYAKKTLPLTEAGARDIGPILTLIKDAQTPESIEKAFERIDELAGVTTEKTSRRKNVAKVNRLIKWMTGLKKSGTKRVGKFSYKDTKQFQELKDVNDQAIKLTKVTNSTKATEEAKQEAQANLDKLWNDINEKENKTALDDAMMKLIELRRLGSKASSKLAEIVSNELELIYNAAKDAKTEEDVSIAIQRRDDKESIISFLENDKNVKSLPWYKKALKDLNTKTADWMGNWETLLTMLGGNELRDKYSLLLHEADMATGKQETTNRILDEAKSIYNVDSRRKTLDMIHDLSKKEYSLRQPNRKGKEGKVEPMELSKLHLMDIYNAIKNEDVQRDYYMSYGDITLNEDGSRDIEAQMQSGKERIDALIENLSEADKQFADAMQAELDKYYDKLNEIHITLYNRDLPRVENYWPSTAEREVDIDVMEQFFIDSRHPSATKERSAHRTPEPRDAFNKFTKHVDEAEWYSNMSLPINEINKAFKDKNIQSLINDKRGEKFNTQLSDAIKNVGLVPPSKGVPKSELEKGFNTLLSNWVTSKIGATPTVPIKQLLSVINYSENMPTREWVKGFIKALRSGKWGETWAEMMQIPYLKARLGDGYSEAVQRALNGDDNVHKSKVSNAHQAFKNLMTIGTRYGDITAIIFGGKPYLDYLIEKEGLSEKEAVDKFLQDTLRSQQSPFSSSLSKFQNSKNVFARAVFAFANTPSQYMRKLFEANQNYRVVKQQFDKGKANESELKKARKQAIKSHMIYGVINSIVFTSVGAMMNGLMKGSDWDDELWKDILVQIEQSYIGGLPVFKDFVGGATKAALGMKIYDDAKPLIEGLDQVAEAGIKLGQGKAKDPAKEWEKVGQGIATTLGIPYYNIKKTLKSFSPEYRKENQIREAEDKLNKLSKSDNVVEADAALEVKKAYSKAKSKANRLKKQQKFFAAEQIEALIEDSKLNIREDKYNPSDMEMEIKMFNKMVEGIE